MDRTEVLLADNDQKTSRDVWTMQELSGSCYDEAVYSIE